MIKNFKKYNESLRDKTLSKPVLRESIREKMTPVSNEQIQKLIDELDFDLIGVDLKEKGNYGQDLTDVYATKEDGIYFKLGQIRVLRDLVIFYPDFRSIEKHIVPIYTKVDNPRELTNDEKSNIILQLGKDKKFGSSFMDTPETYLDIVKKWIERH